MLTPFSAFHPLFVSPQTIHKLFVRTQTAEALEELTTGEKNENNIKHKPNEKADINIIRLL